MGVNYVSKCGSYIWRCTGEWWNYQWVHSDVFQWSVFWKED